jgi:AcrR family transcriptional regulator
MANGPTTRQSMVDATTARILRAAAKEFVARGFNGVSMAQIAKRARLSRQLVHHHFPSKEGLLKAVNERLYRPTSPWEVEIPAVLDDLIADRFTRRARNLDYMRVLTWEAASMRSGKLPGESDRQRRIAAYGTKLEGLQEQGKLPRDMDHRMIHLTIIALATFPLVFNQVTRLITGRAGTEQSFQRDWAAHLRKLAAQWFTATRDTARAAGSKRGRAGGRG